MNKTKKIIIATGGTGGHVIPAYCLAKHFKAKNIGVEITSDKRGIKYLKENKEIKTTTIMSSSLNSKGIFKFIYSLLAIVISIVRAFFFLLFNRPNLIFGMGGYSSFPVCISAKMLGIPFVIYENNLHIGKANKFLLPFAKKIFLSFKECDGIAEKYQNKILLIGNIIRKEILNIESNFNKTNSESKSLKILILGGSQAAKIFAEKLPNIFKKCKDVGIKIKIFQQCTADQIFLLESFYNNLKIENEIFNFSENIVKYFNHADIAITRSGSSMLAELINSRIPFITVPLPTSADNHQLKNAIYYQKKGYSYLIEEKDLDTKVFKLINSVYENRSILQQIKTKQSQFSDKNVYENIDKEINNFI